MARWLAAVCIERFSQNQIVTSSIFPYNQQLEMHCLE